MSSPETVRVQRELADQGYVADAAISMSLHLARSLRKPLLVEGPAGVGKTEIAKVLASILGTDLIRLQCYEGLDTSTALYEWNYQPQLLQIRMEEEEKGRSLEQKEAHIFSEAFLLKRPLLQAITHHRSPVLLIDELDRADEEFESFLLEVLSDWQISIPELGTIAATHIPYVIVTGNRTRELSDALRRRCFYLWIDYPDFDKELAIVRSGVDGIDAQLAPPPSPSTVESVAMHESPSLASPARRSGIRESRVPLQGLRWTKNLLALLWPGRQTARSCSKIPSRAKTIGDNWLACMLAAPCSRRWPTRRKPGHLYSNGPLSGDGGPLLFPAGAEQDLPSSRDPTSDSPPLGPSAHPAGFDRSQAPIPPGSPRVPASLMDPVSNRLPPDSRCAGALQERSLPNRHRPW